LTTPFFHSTAWPKFSCGRETSTPNLANVSLAWWSACAVCTHAFVGMQPTRRHVPPSSGSCSMQTVFAPSCAARIAAVYPPGPPPRTATSHSIDRQLLSPWSGSMLAPRPSSTPRPPRRRRRSRGARRAFAPGCPARR
jgi:hypothetical protein